MKIVDFPLCNRPEKKTKNAPKEKRGVITNTFVLLANHYPCYRCPLRKQYPFGLLLREGGDSASLATRGDKHN